MKGRTPGRRRKSGKRGVDGFTLTELLLVTLILGILASIAVPYFERARERAYVARIQADVRHLMDGVEDYVIINHGMFPGSIEEMEAQSTYVATEDIEYCLFAAVPETPGREAYVIALAAHAETGMKVFIAFPLWGSRMLDFDSGRRGC
jgi:prepilin-type N-terminal cleavage/methylation domain-containing protein